MCHLCVICGVGVSLCVLVVVGRGISVPQLGFLFKLPQGCMYMCYCVMIQTRHCVFEHNPSPLPERCWHRGQPHNSVAGALPLNPSHTQPHPSLSILVEDRGLILIFVCNANDTCRCVTIWTTCTTSACLLTNELSCWRLSGHKCRLHGAQMRSGARSQHRRCALGCVMTHIEIAANLLGSVDSAVTYIIQIV
jgi:hypothetical protein